MAMTNIQNPQTLTPAYNPVVFTVDSTNKNIAAFRYIFEVYQYLEGSPSEVFVGKFKVAPEPNTGYGYIDISKILSDLLTYDLDTANTSRIDAPNSFVKYRVDVSEEYLYSWDFTSISWTPGAGYFTLNGTTDAIWNLNNLIQIDILTGTDTWAQGIHTVISSPPNVVNVIGEYGGSTGLVTGTVYWLNRTKTVSATLLTYDNYYVFNGAFTTLDFLSYNDADYVIPDSGASATRMLLTDMPADGFYATPDQDLFVNIFSDPAIVNTLRVRVETSDGDIFRTLVWNNSPNDERITQFAIGPNNFTPDTIVSGSLPVIKDTTQWYDFKIVNASNTTLTSTYRVYIDNRCKIEDYEILFLDRMGSFMSYAFQLRSKETGTVERGMYNKRLGEVGVSGWSYISTDAGNTIYSVNTSKQLELNTNWMTDEMSVYFEQLVTSPVTFVKIDGVYVPCTVTDNAFETLRQKNKNLIKRTVTVKFANNDTINI